jgi:hypothetical protein
MLYIYVSTRHIIVQRLKIATLTHVSRLPIDNQDAAMTNLKKSNKACMHTPVSVGKIGGTESTYNHERRHVAMQKSIKL